MPDILSAMRLNNGIYIVGDLVPNHGFLVDGELVAETNDLKVRTLLKKLLVVTDGVPEGVRWVYCVKIDENFNIVFLELVRKI